MILVPTEQLWYSLEVLHLLEAPEALMQFPVWPLRLSTLNNRCWWKLYSMLMCPHRASQKKRLKLYCSALLTWTRCAQGSINSSNK